MDDVLKLFKDAYAGEDTDGWFIPDPETAAQAAEICYGRRLRVLLNEATAYSENGPIFDPPTHFNLELIEIAALAARILLECGQKEEALALLANGPFDGDELREAYALSFEYDERRREHV